MFEGAVAGILNRLLGKYVQDLDTEHLNVGIFSGNVNLSDLKLKPEALYELDLPIDVKIGTIGRVTLQIPWSNLYTQPVVVHIEDVLVLVGPAISNSFFDPEREKRLSRAAKRNVLQDLEADSEILKGPQDFFQHLFTAIMNNIQIYVRNVHVRYEDSISSKDGPLACGLCLQSLSVETTNSKWKPSVTPPNATTVYQMMRIESLSLYWNPTATVLDDNETAHITPMQYYSWKHYMLTGLDKFSMHQEDFEFVLKPVSLKVKALQSRAGGLLLDAVLPDSALQLSRRQLLSARTLRLALRRLRGNRKYRHLHPGVPLSKDVRKWWRYAYNAVVEQRVRPYTWAAIKKHRENYNMYKQTYKSTLRSPNDIELKLDLQKCEDSLPIISVVIAREQAKFELLKQEPDRIKVVETEFDWWKSASSPEAEPETTRVELLVKSERHKSIWSHLSSPERRRVCELIGYVEGEPRSDKGKQCIEHKLNLTLANCSLTLMNRNKEVLVVSLTQFLVSLETRPSARAYKISARTESIVVEGVSSDELVPLLSAERGCGSSKAERGAGGAGQPKRGCGSSHLLAVDFERNPAGGDADYGFSLLMEPIEVVYVEQAITELISFFQTHSMSASELSSLSCAAAARAAARSRALAAHAVSRRKMSHVNVHVKRLCAVLPEHGARHQFGQLMIVDLSRLLIKSDLQPPSLVLEDATCMELEERLYDRLHAECCAQVLLCDWDAPWRDAVKQTDSELHLLPKMKAQIVFSNSIKKDYKLLPKYKLNISLTSLKLNLSERVIVNLLDFADNLPAPAPTTVPVCFRDAGDFAEELQDAELGELLKLDTVHVDPGYADLVRLRQKIVAAYLRRNSPRVPPAPPPSPPPPSEGSDSEPPQFARALDLPGFDDNVSPSNHIETLLRFVIGEIVINLSRSVEHKDRPYITVQVTKVCLDVALLKYGPALQLYIKQALVTDRSHPTSSGQYTELLTTEGELFNLLYRKVRCNCPEFRSHFHSVERSVVADVGGVRLTLHSGAIRDLRQYVQAIGDKIQSRREVDLSSLVPHSQSLWQRLTQGEPDPPVPSGATKFSYSVRLSSVSVSLESATRSLLRLRLAGMESDCVFRANDRLILKAALESLHADDLSAHTLYPKLIWPDEDKVLEMKYVRAAPRFYGNEQRLKADGELRVYVGRIHWVLLCSVIIQVQHFLEPLIPASLFASAAQAAERAVETQTVSLRGWSARLNLVIQIHAPVLLIPQKPSSPSLLVLNMGDLEIENFFKQSPVSQDGSSPVQSPVIDNILAKLANVTLSRAVMTLAGTLEVQEPILEPVSIRCDIQRPCSRGALLRARVECGALCACAGARDLAAVRAAGGVLAERAHLASFVPNSPTEAAAGDASVKDLQAFFAQGDSIRKGATISFSLEGIELKLFTDTDEVLSSPVRDASRGLAKLTAGEVTAQIDYFCDNSMEMKASLQSLLIEDIRPDPSVVIKRIFQSQSGGTKATAGISVSSPPLLELGVRRCLRAHCWDLRVDRSRVNLQMSLLMQLSRALLLQMPGDQTLEGGVVNLGYVGEGRAEGGEGRGRPPSSDCTSGYFSAASALSENTPGLSVSIQFRQPEIMLYTDIHKSEPHALLLRSELLIDYSHHANNETLVVSLAGLQVMSKLQSKLQNIPPLMVLMPCDVEYSKCFKNVEEGVKVKMTVSDVEVNIAPTTVHTVLDIIEEISTELTMVDEKEIFNFATYDPKAKKADEDLWSPKKLELYMPVNPDESYQPPKYTSVKPTESFELSVPSVKVVFEMEQAVRVPVLVIKLSVEQSLQDWSSQLQGRGRVAVSLASAYTCACDAWEPLLQPNVLTSVILQGKSYPMSSQLNTKPKEEETETDGAFSEVKRAKKRTGFESETSADEADTDNEMVFIKNPNRREHKSYNSGYNARNMQFISALDGDESDSENENGLMDKFATAIGHLFTDDSSDEQSNDEDSSAPQSEAEVSDREDDKAVTFTDGNVKSKREGEHKTVTLQDPIHQESVDSGLESDSEERVCSYLFLEVKEPLELTLTPGAVETLVSLLAAYRSRAGLPGAAAATAELSLVNDIGPGSTLQLRTRAETDLAGRPRVLVTADYDNDTSRPSTPGCDTSGADLLDVKESKPEMADLADEWEICESGRAFSPSTPLQPPPSQDVTDLYRRHTDRLLSIRLHDMDQLTVLCPQRSACKLHVLHPSKHNTRYYIVVERTSKYNSTTIVVRSPLQVRNETSYALELYYKTTDLQAVGEDLVGSLTNPFDDKMRIAVLAPHDTYNVPLYIAYHCKLFLLPSNFESYQTATQGIWWMELASDVGTPRDIVCPAKADDDPRIFAMRILTDEGCQSTKVTRSIPNYVIRVLPPLAIYNRLPVAVELTRVAGVKGEETRGEGNPPWSIRIEAGDVYTAYTFELTKTHKIGVEVQYMGMPWKGTFTLSPELTEKPINMVSEMDSLPGSRPGLCARVERGARCHLFLFARYWLINKTGLPLQGKGRHSDTVTELGPSVALWRGPGALRLRAPQGAWSRAVWPLAAAPGLLALRRAALRCRLLLAVTLSELCPQLTKIITILPYFLVYNDTKRPLRFMEENEAADLWIDLAPQQCTAFWPQTDSMMMHCKYRDSGLVSQHFPITKNHFTVLRMDKGTAICVEVTGGTDRPFTVTFRSYCAGAAPVRVHNLCDDLFLKLHQMDSGQVALLSPYQSLLYTWDDPAKERVLMWNIYNNKGKGYVADFMQDGYGEEKVSFHSVKHSTLVATNSVTSKLSSTLKRLAPRSPPAESSSDSDSSQQPDTHARKVRKDKVTVYWISYMDGHQRVFALAQDERIAYQYRMRINSERSNFEVYASIAGLGLSVCVQRNQIVKELAYISMTDSLPRWEVNFNHKWKQLSPDLTAWIEDKYQQDQKKCQLKDYLHIDLEKMQMTKPFFAELRRDYSPGIWMQLRKSDTYTYFDLKVQRLQIDNQLMDAVFPCVLYPAPLITDSRASKVKPCLEIVALKQHRLSLNQDVYKYLKILVQEYNINLDRGFVNYVFDILNHWKIEEKPAVRLRADLALVHMPLSMIAVKGQTKAQKSNLFEFVHLSPLKLVLSLSSRGYSAENTDSPGRTRFRNKKEDRPKLFNSDLLEYIFNSWGSSLCDMKDVVLRMSYLEFRNAPITLTTLLSLSRRHYTVQLLQQFYVLALGLRVLGNPYSVMGDFTKGLRDYYEPHTGVAHADGLSIAQRVCAGAARLLGHSAARGPAMFDDVSALRLYRRKADCPPPSDLPTSLAEINRTHPATVALALAGLVARPAGDICREATRAALTRQYGALSAEAALRSCFECNPRGLVARRRLPRHCPPNEGVGPYSAHAALGAALLAACAGRDARGGGGGGAARERYAAHAPLPPAGAATLLLSTENLYMVRSGAHAGWHVEWAVRLDDLIGVPAIHGDKLVLNIKQDELVNYYATDEKVIEISDPELLAWIHNKIECALIMALEDKRVPDE